MNSTKKTETRIITTVTVTFTEAEARLLKTICSFDVTIPDMLWAQAGVARDETRKLLSDLELALDVKAST